MKKFVMTVAVAAALAFAGQANAASMLSDHNGINLRRGSTGTRVMELQACMNAAGYDTGVVDGIYGKNTEAGVKAFQLSKGLVADGIVGKMTTPAFQMACKTGEMAEDDSEEESADVSEFDINDGEEADFTDVDVEDADDDTIEEGENKAELAEIEFELEEGGAALLERMDVILDYTGAEAADEDDAWEVFETIYLMVDGDVIAEMDADDEDDWEDNSTVGDETRFRMSGINHVFDAEEEHVVVVAADIAGSLDLGADEQADWTFTLVDTGMRFVDEAGITLYLDEESSASSDTATFTIEEEGQDDELDVQTSNNDVDSTTLKVEDDESSDDYTVFVFELEADEDSSDLDIDKVPVMVEVSGGDYNDIVKDEMITIDGDDFDDVAVKYYTDNTFATETASSGTTPSSFALLTFDVDEDFTVDADETVDVELVLEFKAADGTNYSAGATVMAKVASDSAINAMDHTDVTAEGADDVVADGSATGDVHTLQVEGINAETSDTSASVEIVDGATNDQATFEIEVEVEAFEEDAFISQIAATSITYTLIDASTGVASVIVPTAEVVSLSSSASLENGYYEVNEGDTETFTVTVTYEPGAAGSFRMQLDSIGFAGTAVAPTSTYNTLPVEDFQTGNVNIIG